MSHLRITLIVVVLLVSMILSGVLAVQARRGAVLLGLLSVLWVLVDQEFEGPVVIDLLPRNGLTASDLVGVVGFVVACCLFVRRAR